MSQQINFEKAKHFFNEMPANEKWCFIALFLSDFYTRKITTTTVFRLTNANNFKKNLFFMLVQQFEKNGDEAKDFVSDFCTKNKKQSPNGTGMVRAFLQDGRILCSFVNQFDWSTVLYWEWYDDAYILN